MVGAVIWGAITFYGEAEIGYVAWGIGALVGFVVAATSRGGGAAAGTIAVLVTILSICGGKYLGASWSVAKAFDDEVALGFEPSEEGKISMVAGEIFDEALVAGEYADFVLNEQAEGLDYYPPAVQKMARDRWEGMNQTERTEFVETKIATIKRVIEDAKSGFVMEAFKNSFSGFDLIFFGLGIITAWQLAFRDPE